jgi:hypothetical protein
MNEREGGREEGETDMGVYLDHLNHTIVDPGCAGSVSRTGLQYQLAYTA